MARLNADGSLDASFDSAGIPSNGKFILPLGTGDDNARAIALQTDGKILVAGYCDNGGNQDVCVARVHGGPFAATQCSLDMDGDGKVQATVDGLISTRVMLGMTGSAVTGRDRICSARHSANVGGHSKLPSKPVRNDDLAMSVADVPATVARAANYGENLMRPVSS
jgi:hypothetical protein